MGSDGQHVTLGGGGLDSDNHLLQRTYGWSVTMLLHGYTVIYDKAEDEEIQAQQQAQR